MNPLLMAIIGWLLAIILMSVVWLVQRRTGKAGIVDIAWPLCVGGLATLFCLGNTAGDESRRILIAALALIWAVRLSAHIAIRLSRETDDSRYLELREKWGDEFQFRLFRFYQLQAFGGLLFALPMLIASMNPEPLGMLDGIGVLVWIIAIVGETIADRQLKAFRLDPANQGKVCDTGLWRYSRHPNYFFEWVHWWSYLFFALGGPVGWINLFAPLAMLFFILRVTGIPPAEASSLKSRGQAYRDYQKRTSAFFPMPPRTVEGVLPESR